MDSSLPVSSPGPVGPAPSPPVLVSAKQAAETLAIGPRKLWGMTASGEVACVRLGGCVRYSVAELILRCSPTNRCSHGPGPTT